MRCITSSVNSIGKEVICDGDAQLQLCLECKEAVYAPDEDDVCVCPRCGEVIVNFSSIELWDV